MEDQEQPKDKVPNCSCHNPNRRPCQYEVLYDEALCQVESLQRQVRHLRTEMRRVEDENVMLVQQISKCKSEPQPDIKQLKIKHENDVKKREESWQRELQRWRKEFQNRDAEINMLRARIAELESEHVKPVPSELVQPEVPCAASDVLSSSERTLGKKNDAASPVQVNDKCTSGPNRAVGKSYAEMMDELFGSSPEPDVAEKMDESDDSELPEKCSGSKATKMEQDKTVIGKPSARDDAKPTLSMPVLKDVDVSSVESLKTSKQLTAKSTGATINRKSVEPSPAKIALPLPENQKPSAESKTKDTCRNVFDKMKLHSKDCAKVNRASTAIVASSHVEKHAVQTSGTTAGGDKPREVKKKLPSSKDDVKVNSVCQKNKKSNSPKKVASPELEKKTSAENIRMENVTSDHDNKKHLLEVSSKQGKEHILQKRNKSSSEKLGSSKSRDVAAVEQKTEGTVLEDGMSSLNRPVCSKKDSASSVPRKDKKSSGTSLAKSTTESKTEVARKVRASDPQTPKSSKKTGNMSDYERVKAYMVLANRINCEKKHVNQPEKVKRSGEHSQPSSTSSSSSNVLDHSQSTSVVLDQCRPSNSCYSPSVLPVKDDEYDPFNPGIDVFPMSKYNVEKDGSGAGKKFSSFQKNMLKISSMKKTEKNEKEAKVPSDIHEEYSPPRISRAGSVSPEEKLAEPVPYFPSSTSCAQKKHSPQPSPPRPTTPSQNCLPSESKPYNPEKSPVPDPMPERASPCISLEKTIFSQEEPTSRNKLGCSKHVFLEKSIPPTSWCSLQDTAEAAAEASKQQLGKPAASTFNESCVTTSNSVIIPQLNLSSIGDSLLSGVREALNMVKTLAPQTQTCADDSGCTSTPQSCQEKQAPSLQGKKKEVPVLMPSPLKKPPKDRDSHNIRAKILCSIDAEGTDSTESSDNKSLGDKISKVGRMWRKRKRLDTAEPKSILKKARSTADDEVTADTLVSTSQSRLCDLNKLHSRELTVSNLPVRASNVAGGDQEKNNNSAETESPSERYQPSEAAGNRERVQGSIVREPKGKPLLTSDRNRVVSGSAKCEINLPKQFENTDALSTVGLSKTDDDRSEAVTSSDQLQSGLSKSRWRDGAAVAESGDIPPEDHYQDEKVSADVRGSFCEKETVDCQRSRGVLPLTVNCNVTSLKGNLSNDFGSHLTSKLSESSASNKQNLQEFVDSLEVHNNDKVINELSEAVSAGHSSTFADLSEANESGNLVKDRKDSSKLETLPEPLSDCVGEGNRTTYSDNKVDKFASKAEEAAPNKILRDVNSAFASKDRALSSSSNRSGDQQSPVAASKNDGLSGWQSQLGCVPSTSQRSVKISVSDPIKTAPTDRVKTEAWPTPAGDGQHKAVLSSSPPAVGNVAVKRESCGSGDRFDEVTKNVQAVRESRDAGSPTSVIVLSDDESSCPYESCSSSASSYDSSTDQSEAGDPERSSGSENEEQPSSDYRDSDPDGSSSDYASGSGDDDTSSSSKGQTGESLTDGGCESGDEEQTMSGRAADDAELPTGRGTNGSDCESESSGSGFSSDIRSSADSDTNSDGTSGSDHRRRGRRRAHIATSAAMRQRNVEGRDGGDRKKPVARRTRAPPGRVAASGTWTPEAR